MSSIALSRASEVYPLRDPYQHHGHLTLLQGQNGTGRARGGRFDKDGKSNGDTIYAIRARATAHVKFRSDKRQRAGRATASQVHIERSGCIIKMFYFQSLHAELVDGGDQARGHGELPVPAAMRSSLGQRC